jgi:putative addiction module killer protein
MTKILKTVAFADWLDALRDISARALIQARIERLACGHSGDTRSVGMGVHEMRIDHGPGYRVYFTRIKSEVVLLLVGGSKKSQAADILAARRLVVQLRRRES